MKKPSLVPVNIAALTMIVGTVLLIIASALLATGEAQDTLFRWALAYAGVCLLVYVFTFIRYEYRMRKWTRREHASTTKWG